MIKNYKKKRLLFLFLVFTISILALIFIINNFRQEIVFFYSASELKNVEIVNKIKGRQVRVGGLVMEKTVKKIDALTTIFVITDLENEVEITYSGLLPDLFRENQGVVAKGEFLPEKNQFIASELLVKHDEKYMPPEVANSLKEKSPTKK